MVDRRKAKVDWLVADEQGQLYDNGAVCALLMDIRHELKRLNRLLKYDRVYEIPTLLSAIRRNTAKPKRRKP